MPNLKLIGLRLKSVTNIQKITQSMKMVSAAKFAKAERDLKAARPLGEAAQAFYKTAEVRADRVLTCVMITCFRCSDQVRDPPAQGAVRGSHL